MAGAVVLLSGGLDSGVALALWSEAGGSIELCLTADYGQRAAAPELRVAQQLSKRFGAAWQVVELPWLGEVAAAAGTRLFAGQAEPPSATRAAPGDESSAAAVWVPARNVVLLSVAAAYAEQRGAEAVVAGFNREEAATFADNSADFAAAMTGALALGTRNGVRVESPTIGMDKAAIVAAARRLGLARDDFWSCYRGGSEPCGHCESCARSARAWAEASV